MRPLLETIAITCLIATPALGQTTPQPTMQTPPVTPPGNATPATSQTMPPAPPAMPPTPQTGTAMPDSAAPPRPSNWSGTDAQWAEHVRKCQKHSGYDPATDQYRTSSGAMRTCPH